MTQPADPLTPQPMHESRACSFNATGTRPCPNRATHWIGPYALCDSHTDDRLTIPASHVEAGKALARAITQLGGPPTTERR